MSAPTDPLRPESDEASDNDSLDRRPIAARVAKLILNYSENKPLVVGVYAPWGDGKTTFLNLLETELKEIHSEKVLVTWFSPWMFSGQENLTWEFFEKLAFAVSKETGFGDLVEDLKKFGRRLRPLAKLPFVKQLGKVVSPAAETVENFMGAESVEELSSKINTRISLLRKRLVVFIDDIDRLEKGEIFEIIRLVKSTAKFSSVIYVLAFDEAIVSAAIQERFQDSTEDGSKFLEKIVQIPIILPRPNRRRLSKILFEKVENVLKQANIQLTPNEENEVGTRVGRGSDAVIHNIRDINRFVNALCFSLPIVKDEVHLGEFITLELMRIFAPNVYNNIRIHERLITQGVSGPSSNLITENKETTERLLATICKDLQPRKKDWVEEELFELFPSLSDRLHGTATSRNYKQEIRERRISGNKFRQFFELVVPPDDISELEMTALEESLWKQQEENSIRLIDRITNVLSDAELLRRLNARKRNGTWVPNEVLISSFVKISERRPVPNYLGPLNLALGEFSQAIDALLLELPLEYRESLARFIIKSKLSIEQLLRWYWIFRTPEHRRGSDGRLAILPRDIELELEKEIANMIERQLKRENLLEKINDSSVDILFAWAIFSDRERTTQYLSKYLLDQASALVDFLRYFTDAWPNPSNEAERNIKMPLFKTEKLVKIMDPKIIFHAIQKHFAPQMASLDVPVGEGGPFRGYWTIRAFLNWYEDPKTNMPLS